MSKERTNIGTVILTTCGIWIVIIAGWFVTTRYLGQQSGSAPSGESEAAGAAGRARHRTPRALQNASARSGREEGESSSAAGPGAAPGAVEADSREEGESSSAGERGTEAPKGSGDDAVGERDESTSASAAAQAAEAPGGADSHEDPRTIVEEAQRRTDAKSHQYEGLLQMFDAKKKISEKRWTFERLGSHGHSKELLRFTAPAEVKGVALLIFNHPDRASDQWMWTPAIERDRRIAIQDRSTRFFGTDFTFEDLEERDVDQYDYSMQGSETIDGATCWKIQWTPKQSRSSRYSRSTGWIRKDNYALMRLDNYVRDEVVKRLTYSSIENIQGIWTARQLEMSDLRRGSHTRLTLEQISYGIPMKEENFTLQAIRHP